MFLIFDKLLKLFFLLSNVNRNKKVKTGLVSAQSGTAFLDFA